MKISAEEMTKIKQLKIEIDKSVSNIEAQEYSIEIKATRQVLQQIIQFLES